MKKLLSLMLAMAMMVCAFAIPAVAEELPVVTIFTYDDNVDYPLSLEDRPALKEIAQIARDRFGIELNLETVISSEFVNVLNTRLASGTDLPDLVRFYASNLSSTDLINYYNQGLIVDLLQYADVMPNTIAAMEAYPGCKAAGMDADGHLLAQVSVVVNPQHVTKWTYLNYDWLDALGLEVPTDAESFYQTLKAFQENDMNGDGLPNEAMLGTNFSAMNQVMYPLFGEGLMTSAQDSWGVDADGKVFSTMTSDTAKEYVTYMNKLFSEGLIWEQAFASPTDEEQTQFRLTGAMAGSWGNFWDGLLLDTSMNAYGVEAHWTPIHPVDEKIVITNYAGDMRYMMTKDCPAQEKVAAFLDWFFTVEGTDYSYYGEAQPGGNYYVRDTSSYDSLGLTAADYEMVGTDKYFEELQVEVNLNNKIGANTLFPRYMPGTASQVAADFYFGYDADVCGLNCDVNYVMEQLDWAMANGVNAPMFASQTSEQADIMLKHSDLFSYMDEQMKGFISGAISLDNWDAYVAQCESMGIADVTAVMQARYDAFLAA